jgi:hypothetical protein
MNYAQKVEVITSKLIAEHNLGESFDTVCKGIQNWHIINLPNGAEGLCVIYKDRMFLIDEIEGIYGLANKGNR